jgi:hypothetical protein
MSKLTERVQTPEQLKLEMDAVSQLIVKREAWLNDKTNQMRTTYMSVKNDTEALLRKLGSLQRTYEQLTINNTKNETKR